VPEAQDCTRHSGMFNADGGKKVWGSMFESMAPAIKASKPAGRLPVRTFDGAANYDPEVRQSELVRLTNLRRTEGDFVLKQA